MKFVELTKGKRAIVDNDMYDFLNQWKWTYHSQGYAYRQYKVNGKYVPIFMHRLIIKACKGELVDHINGDRLDNQKSNLRICNWNGNARNKNKIKRVASSRFIGVSKVRDGVWQVGIRNGKRVHIGFFNNEHYAALAYDLWAVDLHGEFAKTNFQHL
jgi:putative component of toxin-antitoxin plasmid stabilization module